MLIDARGVPLTARREEAVALLDAATLSYCALGKKSGELVKAALAVEPDLVMGLVLRGYFMLLIGKRDFVPRAADALGKALAAAEYLDATARERTHLDALRLWTAGRMRDAAAALEAILVAEPRDLLAARIAQHLYFYLGEAGAMRQSAQRLLPQWDRAWPGYGFLLGCHAFALVETGEFAAAEAAGRAAVALNPGDAWAAHAVAHVCEMQNRLAEGLAWIDAQAAQWSEMNNFIFHLRWHRCLYLLDQERYDAVLESYDREVRPSSTDEHLDISNAVALLWRCEQCGVDVGDRWAELAEQSRKHAQDHLLVFPDIHYAMALAAIGDDKALSAWRDDAAGFAAAATEDEAATMQEIGLVLADAAVAHRQGAWRCVLDLLLARRGEIVRIGGSNAQRDLFVRLLVDAARKAGDHDTVALLLGERARQRASDQWAAREAALLHVTARS